MRKIVAAGGALALACVMPLSSVAAQMPTPSAAPETALSQPEDCVVSAYASLLCQGSRIGRSSAVVPGARAALLLDNIEAGIAGYTLHRPVKRSALSGERYSGNEPYIDLGYGGFLFAYHFRTAERFSISAGATVGGGSYSFTEKNDQCGGKGRKMTGRNFFYIEPELAAYVTVSKYCRLGAGISYRYFRHAGAAEFSDRDFRGAGATFSASFGVF